jgi:hypothetical protein
MRPDLPTVLTTMACAMTATAAIAATDTFDQLPAGKPPAGWTCGATGGGPERWTVEADASAPTPQNVLKQSRAGTFPWCVKTGVAIVDGFVAVRFKPIAGREDQAGGVVWHFRDGDNYNVARANALENNVSLYHTEHGSRMMIKYVDAPVAPQPVASAASGIRRLPHQGNARRQDVHRSRGQPHHGPGSVGVSTKADSITAFDDFSFDGK